MFPRLRRHLSMLPSYRVRTDEVVNGAVPVVNIAAPVNDDALCNVMPRAAGGIISERKRLYAWY